MSARLDGLSAGAAGWTTGRVASNVWSSSPVGKLSECESERERRDRRNRAGGAWHSPHGSGIGTGTPEPAKPAGPEHETAGRANRRTVTPRGDSRASHQIGWICQTRPVQTSIRTALVVHVPLPAAEFDLRPTWSACPNATRLWRVVAAALSGGCCVRSSNAEKN